MQAIIVIAVFAIVAGLGQAQDMPAPGICGVSSIKPTATARVVNGENVNPPHSRPYQLLLVGFFPNGTAKHYCGASLIKPTHVLTAAHCVVGYAAEDIRIYPGLHYFQLSLLTKENGVPSRQVFVHESYAASGLNNDVAVIRLARAVDVDLEKIGLVCLTKKGDICNSGEPVVASGWGALSGNKTLPPSLTRPTELQQVRLQCVDKRMADCKSLTHLLGIFEQKEKMCAYAEGKSVCFGDSGGPLVRTRKLSDGTEYVEQVGIMSGTIDCSLTKPRPDVYASVAELQPWILGKVKVSM